MLGETLFITAMVALVLVNAAGVVLCALQLPGTWLIVLATGLVAWWQWDAAEGPVIGAWAMGTLVGLGLLGELIEFLGGAVGSSQTGGTKRGAVLAVGTGIVGALVGTAAIPVPVIGTLIGAAVGAGVGSLLGDLWAGRSLELSLKSGSGAAVGRFLGAAGKLTVAVVMWLVATVAVVWP